MATVSENSLAATIDRFLQYLRVERNASPLTIKSYREDLEPGRIPGRAASRPLPRAGRTDDARSARLRLGHALGRLRQDDHRPAPGFAAELFSLWPARRVDQDQPGQAAP